MISVFGDESSSTAHATYGLFAIADSHLALLDLIVQEIKAMLGGLVAEPLHAKVLFHKDKRAKSSFKSASRSDVLRACSHLFSQISRLEIGFYHGLVERDKAPKVMFVPLLSSESDKEVFEARMKLDLVHLQFFAFGGAASHAHSTLPSVPTRVLADKNKSVVRWFNENRQASRLLELFSLPNWPSISLASDEDHPGLQVADVLTYFATRQFFDREFSKSFDLVRHKAQFVTYEFAAQVLQPFNPPTGVSVKELPKKK